MTAIRYRARRQGVLPPSGSSVAETEALGMHRQVTGFGRLLRSTTIANGPSRRT